MCELFRRQATVGSISLLIFLLFSGGGCRRYQKIVDWQKDLEYKSSEIFPIKVGKYGYPYVQVIINDQELEMAFDTGNMSGLLVSPDTACRLGLSSVGESKHYDSSGEAIGTYLVFRVPELVVFDKVWTEEQAHEHRSSGLIGLIGPRYVYGKRFTLDYQNKVIAVSESPFLRIEQENITFPLIQSKDHEGMIIIGGEVNGHQVLIQIDTGKSRTCVDPELVKKIDLPEVKRGYRIDNIQLGLHSFKVSSAKKVSFKGISGDLPEPILLGIGSDILSQVVLSVDYSKQIVMITK
jgi:predicted aspartyl protease